MTAPISSLSTLHQGQQGRVRIISNVAGAAVILEVKNGKWNLSKDRGKANATNSQSNNVKQYKATIKIQEGTVELFFEDDHVPNVLGFEEGNTIELFLGVGDTNKCWHSQEVLVLKLDWANDQDEDLVKITLGFHGNKEFLWETYPTAALTTLPLGG